MLQRLPYVLKPEVVLESIKRRAATVEPHDCRTDGKEQDEYTNPCIGDGATRWQNWVRELQQHGYGIVNAAHEREAATLLRICAIDVVCIDSQIVAEPSGSEIVADLKDTSPGVPVLLVQTGNEATEHFRSAIDGSAFATVGSRLIEEFREIRFPTFVEWFEAWEERTVGKGRDVVHIC